MHVDRPRLRRSGRNGNPLRRLGPRPRRDPRPARRVPAVGRVANARRWSGGRHGGRRWRPHRPPECADRPGADRAVHRDNAMDQPPSARGAPVCGDNPARRPRRRTDERLRLRSQRVVRSRCPVRTGSLRSRSAGRRSSSRRHDLAGGDPRHRIGLRPVRRRPDDPARDEDPVHAVSRLHRPRRPPLDARRGDTEGGRNGSRADLGSLRPRATR